MSVEIFDGSTIRSFIEDDEAFSAAVRRRFEELDADRDGVLSFPEMLRELKSLRVVDLTDEVGVDKLVDYAREAELYRSLFEQFDRDSDGVVGPEEYAAETKEMMLAIARGLGSIPIKMLVEEDSLFKKAVDREAALMATV